jgi:hypothetical protein
MLEKWGKEKDIQKYNSNSDENSPNNGETQQACN